MFVRLAFLTAFALAGCGNSFGSADFAAKVEDAQHSSDIVRFGKVIRETGIMAD